MAALDQGGRRGLMAPLLALQEARGHLLPFATIAIGIGIAVWFHWPGEPARPAYLTALAGLVVALALFLRGPELLRPCGALGAAVMAGFLAGGIRAQTQDAPMLDWHYYGPVEGRVIELDRSSSDALRVTLDRVVLEDVAPARTPVKVRVSLHGAQPFLAPEPGQTVILTAHLAAPESAVEPGGFDFRRMAFFEQLGAVGYTRSPVLLLEPPGTGEEWISRLRAYLSAGMRAHIEGDAGAFAAGAMTGDRSGIGPDTVKALRDSSLAHLLAISGMNMAFLVAFVFGLIRTGIALIPPLALRVNSKKVAAVLSLGVALFYLLLSGANVATERAFIMVCVVLGAVLSDRRAITLRSAAISGAILLLVRPESLLEPGFQMSFAATVALVSGFKVLDHKVMLERWPRWTVPAFTLVASSVLAGVATAPYAAAHFNRFTDYGLLANLLTVPVMGAVVMPAGTVAALLAPFGLAALPLWIMGLGVRWILFVAHWIADLDGAVTAIPSPGTWAVTLVTLGGLWLIAWPGRARLAGVALIVAGLAIWPLATRPDLLIAGDGRLLGLMGPEGRALSAGKGGGFAAENWLENDGDLADQQMAAARPGFTGPKDARRFELAGKAGSGLTGVVLTGKGALEKLAQACGEVDLVVIAAKADAVPQGCVVIDQRVLRETGALAIWLDKDGLTIRASRDGARIWTGKPMDPGVLPVLNARDAVVALQ